MYELTIEDFKEIADAECIVARLSSCEWEDPQYDYFEVILHIRKVSSEGVYLKDNEYGVNFAPYGLYKNSWALRKEDLK